MAAELSFRDHLRKSQAFELAENVFAQTELIRRGAGHPAFARQIMPLARAQGESPSRPLLIDGAKAGVQRFEIRLGQTLVLLRRLEESRQAFHAGLAAHTAQQDLAEERFLILVETPEGFQAVLDCSVSLKPPRLFFSSNSS